MRILWSTWTRSLGYDEEKCFHCAIYKALPVKDLKNILSTRGQLRSGTKDQLLIQLEHGDKRRFTFIRTSAEMKIKMAEYNSRQQPAKSHPVAEDSNASPPTPPNTSPDPRIVVEAASDNEQGAVMEDNESAIEMFPPATSGATQEDPPPKEVSR